MTTKNAVMTAAVAAFAGMSVDGTFAAPGGKDRKIEPGFGGSWPVTMPKLPPKPRQVRGKKRRK